MPCKWPVLVVALAQRRYMVVVALADAAIVSAMVDIGFFSASRDEASQRGDFIPAAPLCSGRAAQTTSPQMSTIISSTLETTI